MPQPQPRRRPPSAGMAEPWGQLPQKRSPPLPVQDVQQRVSPEGAEEFFDDESPVKGMDNFEGGFNDDVDNEGFFDDPRDTFTGDPNYNQAVSRAQLAKTYFPKQIETFIRKSTLFPDTKATMMTITHGLFDKTEVLAKTENVTLEFIDVDIILAQARIGFHPMDVDNPDLSTLMNMIMHHYKRYISRSVNGWERGLQNVIETSHTNRNVMEQRPQMGGFGQKKPWYRRFI